MNLHTALAQKAVICIGVGGARSWLENLARVGVRHFVLFDGDKAEAHNVRTQMLFPDEAGAYKVDLVAAQLRRIAPDARVTAVRRYLDDTLDDDTFLQFASGALATPRNTLLAGCTDSFPAQARSAALSLNFGTPYLAAQLYREGLAGEIFFSYPGVTTGGCARCALESRYRAYAAHGFRSDVTSEGADIFATERLNALKGTLALSLLLYREPLAGRYCALLDCVRSRNLVLLRNHPDAAQTLGLDLFHSFDHRAGDLACFDEPLWIEQHPNHPSNGEALCPLCGGAADLSALIGTIPDTRILL